MDEVDELTKKVDSVFASENKKGSDNGIDMGDMMLA